MPDQPLGAVCASWTLVYTVGLWTLLFKLQIIQEVEGGKGVSQFLFHLFVNLEKRKFAWMTQMAEKKSVLILQISKDKEKFAMFIFCEFSRQ